MSRRFAVGVAYVGGRFSGFAANTQAALPAVEDQLLAALSKLSPNYASFQVSSRTDAGVHALRNVFSVDVLNPALSEDNIRQGLNFHLAPQVRGAVRVTDVKLVAPDFDARLHATGRTYVYRVVESAAPSTGAALMHQHQAWVLEQARGNSTGRASAPLDVAAMRACVPLLMGERDFASFQSSGCQSQSTHRNVTQLEIAEAPAPPPPPPPQQQPEEQELGQPACIDPLFSNCRLVTLTISANAFLLRQCRNMVSALVAVGQGRLRPEELEWIMQARDRAAVVAKYKMSPAPAAGLYLLDVHYDDRHGRGSRRSPPSPLRH